MQTKNRILAIAILTGGIVLTGCSRDGGSPPPSSPPLVDVVITKEGPFELTTELPGRTSPYQIAEIRPQVTGIVQKRLFVEGSDVKSGSMLYQIDPAVYQAAYDSARATLARAEANLNSARLKAERYRDLVKIDAVSKQDFDDATAALKQTEADVAAGRAAVETARINLNYTKVEAPIKGRIGRSAITAGALVSANQPDALATIQQLDPIYVDLTQSSTELLRLRRDLENGRLQRADSKGNVPVRLVLEDESSYQHQGKLAFSEVTVDQTTGSVTLRAEFPNPDGFLLPGMYVRAILDQGINDNVIMLPHKAVTHDPRGNARVLVLNAENVVEARQVKVGLSTNEAWVITEGLQAGERVITTGLQKIRPGASAQVASSEEHAKPAAAQQ